MIKRINEVGDRLKEENLVIEVYDSKTMPDDLVDQLLQKSRQSHVSALDIKPDKSGRFASYENYKKWASGGRTIYFLMHSQKDAKNIAGILWFGQKQNKLIGPEYKITFGIRIYEEFLGKGLAKPFLNIGHEDIKEIYKEGDFWLETDDDNIAGMKAYEGLGYKTLAHKGNRLTMGLKR